MNWDNPLHDKAHGIIVKVEASRVVSGSEDCYRGARIRVRGGSSSSILGYQTIHSLEYSPIGKDPHEVTKLAKEDMKISIDRLEKKLAKLKKELAAFPEVLPMFDMDGNPLSTSHV